MLGLVGFVSAWLVLCWCLSGWFVGWWVGFGCVFLVGWLSCLLDVFGLNAAV